MPRQADPTSITPPKDIGEMHDRFLGLQDDTRKGVQRIKGLSLSTTETPVAHSLGAIPSFVRVRLLGSATVYESTAATSSLVYLTASGSVTVDIEVVR